MKFQPKFVIAIEMRIKTVGLALFVMIRRTEPLDKEPSFVELQ